MTNKNLSQKLDILLTKASKVTAGKADASILSGWAKEIDFEQDKLKLIKGSKSVIMDLRLFKNDKIGVSATNKIDEESIQEVVGDALDVSGFGHEGGFDLPSPAKNTKSPKLFDPQVEKLGVDYFINIGEKIINRVKQEEPEMIVNDLVFDFGTGESVFGNTKGVREVQRGSHVNFGLEFSKVSQSDFFQLYGGRSARRIKDLDIDGVVDDLLKKAKWGKRIAEVKSGNFPVIFSPEASISLFEYLIGAASGKSVREGTSKLAGKLGKKVFAEGLTITDDPTIDFAESSYELDDEGVPGKMKNLIEKGVVKNFYYDLYEAAKAKVKPTGNGDRHPYMQAQPSVSNILISGGEKPYSKLIKNIKQGLLVNFLLGAGQNNPYNGDFQFGIILGFLIENGEIVGRVKNASIAGNVFDLLRNNLMWLSSDRETLGAFTSPFICLDGISVTSKSS